MRNEQLTHLCGRFEKMHRTPVKGYALNADRSQSTAGPVRLPAVLAVTGVLTLSSCVGQGLLDSLSQNPAGMLAYPGARITNTVQTIAEQASVLRIYSVAAAPTARAVFDWYSSHLSTYGYTSPVTYVTTHSPGSMNQVFQGRGGTTIDVGVILGEAYPSAWPPIKPNTQLPPKSKVLQLKVSQINVTIE